MSGAAEDYVKRDLYARAVRLKAGYDANPDLARGLRALTTEEETFVHDLIAAFLASLS